MYANVDIKKEFGSVVKQMRIQLGLSQERLAERAGLHRTYVTDVERGMRNLSLESISKLARALGVSMSSLFSSQEEAPPPESAQSESARPVDILLVEDEPHDVELTLEAFKAAKLANRIHVVHDGAAALDFVFDRNGQRKQSEPLPEVVLLDLNLPKVQGMEVLRRIKSDKRTQGICVIVLAMSRRDEHAAMQLGADAYLVKPMDFLSFSKVTPQLNCYWSLLKPNGDGGKCQPRN